MVLETDALGSSSSCLFCAAAATGQRSATATAAATITAAVAASLPNTHHPLGDRKTGCGPLPAACFFVPIHTYAAVRRIMAEKLQTRKGPAAF